MVLDIRPGRPHGELMTKTKTVRDPKRALDGIRELRAAVRWADGEPESSHDYQTAEQLLARFRRYQVGG